MLHQDSPVSDPYSRYATVQIYLDGSPSPIGTLNLTSGVGPDYQSYPGAWMLGPAQVGKYPVNLTAGTHTVRLHRVSGLGWSEIAQDGSEITLDYNAGQRTAMNDLSGNTTWAYDLRGRLISETKAITVGLTLNRFTTQYGYDLLDRVLTTTYPTGEVVMQTYNNLGALENLRSTDAAQSYNQWYVSNLDYNANGSLARLDLGNTLSTTYTYDPFNFRLKTLKTGNGNLVQSLTYQYDPIGNVTTITDTAVNVPQQTERFQYDALDRLTNAISVTNGYTGTYGYDAIGNLITKTESATPIVYAYGGGQPHAVKSLSNGNGYQYDANGNMTRRVESGITYTQTWDMENRLTAVTATQGSVISVTQFIYDGDGARVAQVKPDGKIVAYVGSLLEVEYLLPAPPRNLNATAVSATLINVTWTDNSTNEDSFQIERSLDRATWSPRVTVNANTTTYTDTSLICGTTYWYRVAAYNVAGTSAGLITSVTTLACSTPPAAPSNLNPSVVSTQVNLTWSDNSSNETQFEIERLSTSVWSVIATVGANVTSYTDWPCGSDQAAQSMAAGSAQPASIPPGATIFYYRVRAYNASGYSGYSNTTSVAVVCMIIWDMTTTAGSGAMVMTLNSPSSGQIWKSYYRAGSALIAVRVQGDPTVANNGLFFLHSDHLGSASLTTCGETSGCNGVSLGGVVSRQLYDAWGNLRSGTITGTMPTDVGFTGQRNDSYIKLVQMGARWYDPAIGRWLSPDTIVPDPQNPQHLNRMAYTLNNPLRYIDPSGHICLDGTSGNEQTPCWKSEGTSNESAETVAKPQYPAILPPPGTTWILITTQGDGIVSWYDYPVVNDPSATNPSQLASDSYNKMQGSVKLNGQIWNYILDEGEWRMNSWGGACQPPFASATQCVVPYQMSSEYNETDPYQLPTTAAVHQNDTLPLRANAYAYIEAPERDFRILVRTHDACPACKSLQVDILARNPLYNFMAYNGEHGLPTPVFIWVAVSERIPHGARGSLEP